MIDALENIRLRMRIIDLPPKNAYPSLHQLLCDLDAACPDIEAALAAAEARANKAEQRATALQRVVDETKLKQLYHDLAVCRALDLPFAAATYCEEIAKLRAKSGIITDV